MYALIWVKSQEDKILQNVLRSCQSLLPLLPNTKCKEEWCKGQRSAKLLLQRLSQTAVTTVRFNLPTKIKELIQG